MEFQMMCNYWLINSFQVLQQLLFI